MIFKNFYFSSFFVLGISIFPLCSDVPSENPDTTQQKEKHACGSSILDAISPSVGGYSSTNNLPITLNHKQESAVVLISVAGDEAGEGGICSGTLIAPYYVLTAAHCVIPPPRQPQSITKTASLNQITVTFVPSLKDVSPPTTNLTIPAAQLFLHPDFPNTIKGQTEYQSTIRVPGIDIAIIKLAQSPTEHGYEPLPLLFIDPRSIGHNGQIALSAGFGKNTEYQTEGKPKRRWSLLAIGSPEDADFDIMINEKAVPVKKTSYFPKPPAKRNWYALTEYLHISSCSGDSGGPLFFFDENKKPMVTGVLSSGIPIFYSSRENRKYHCLSSLYAFTSLHLNREFIEDVVTAITSIDEDGINTNNKINTAKKPFALCANTGTKGICSQGYATYCDTDTNLLYSEPCFGQQICGLDNNNNNRCIPCDP